MSEPIQKLKNRLFEEPTAFEDEGVNTILDFLYRCYLDEQGSSDTIRANFSKLDALISDLKLEENNEVFYVVCDLCSEYGRRAFVEGVHVGAQLMTELFDR